MKKKLLVIVCVTITVLLFNRCNSVDSKNINENISFYDVPLVCGADPSIGCGSRIKPLFIESSKHNEIKESWVNRKGTAIAFVWTKKPDDQLADKLFKKFDIDYSIINDKRDIAGLSAGLSGREKWYKGMEVDSLSLHEAGTIAATTTTVILDAGLINQEEAMSIQKDIEEYFRKELVQVRSADELEQDGRIKWHKDAYSIYANHIGTERADKVKTYYAHYLEEKSKEKECEKACCDKYK